MTYFAGTQRPFLIIGRAGMDLAPEPPGTAIEEAVQFSACLGGSSANIAAALTRQGQQADLVTCVSDDAVGRFARAQLESYNIGTHYVRAVAGEARNSLAVTESRLEGHQTVIYRNHAADFMMDRQDVEALPYGDYAALVTTGTVLAADPSRSAAFLAFEAARAADVPLVFDLDYRPYSWPSAEVASEVYSRAAGLCDVIVGNDVEFGFMAGDYDRGLAMAEELARTTARLVIYKRGELGAITFADGRTFSTGIYPVDALKPTGAGDSFLGGLMASLARGDDIETAVNKGSACAAIVVTRVGCAPAMPTIDELDAFLSSHTATS